MTAVMALNGPTSGWTRRRRKWKQQLMLPQTVTKTHQCRSRGRGTYRAIQLPDATSWSRKTTIATTDERNDGSKFPKNLIRLLSIWGAIRHTKYFLQPMTAVMLALNGPTSGSMKKRRRLCLLKRQRPIAPLWDGIVSFREVTIRFNVQREKAAREKKEMMKRMEELQAKMNRFENMGTSYIVWRFSTTSRRWIDLKIWAHPKLIGGFLLQVDNTSIYYFTYYLIDLI
jgi:hypothetical protein